MRWAGMIFPMMAALAESPVEAHPHVFLDTILVLTFDSEQQLAQVRVAWLYDAFFSMSLFADMGLDPDLDGKLTDTELDSLQGFNLNWPKDFPGHLYIEVAGVDQPMSGPYDGSIRVQDGRVMSFLSRDLLQPVKIGPAGLTIQNYDPSYYNEFTIRADPTLKNAAPGCAGHVLEPDLGVADRALQAELMKVPVGGSIEGDYPQVGRLYAQIVEVTCPEK